MKIQPTATVNRHHAVAVAADTITAHTCETARENVLRFRSIAAHLDAAILLIVPDDVATDEYALACCTVFDRHNLFAATAERVEASPRWRDVLNLMKAATAKTDDAPARALFVMAESVAERDEVQSLISKSYVLALPHD